MSTVGLILLCSLCALTGGILTGTSAVSKSASSSLTPTNLKFSIDIKNTLQENLELQGSYIFHNDMSSDGPAIVARESNSSVLLGRVRTGTHGVIAYRTVYSNELFAIAFSVSTTTPQSNWCTISTALQAGSIVDQSLYHELRPVENFFQASRQPQKMKLGRAVGTIRASLTEEQGHNKIWKLKVNLD